MLISYQQEDIGDFHIRDLQTTPKRSFKVKGHDALLLSGQRWTFLLVDTKGLEQPLKRHARFSLSWPWNDAVKVIRGQLCYGFWKSDIDFPYVFHINHMLISHQQEDIGDFHIRDLQNDP